ncbi:MAG TPA: EAL domain-containing protein [Gammaproteobacteria bacterium]|nr:EAL domain-containing protein [Gammaproteobacteria bacterium]
MSRFWRSLQFRIPAVFVSAFVLALAAILVVLSTYGKRLLEDYAKREVMLSGQNIVAELGGRIAYAESLAGALANLGEGLAHDAALTQSLVKEVMDSSGTEAFIAGGGLWPEPYQFDPQQERRSFFFGRDAAGALQYLDGYNAPEGAGYHQEEWYVPARHMPPGGAFWSKSYMDPYSYQPMVTVTAPMHRAGRFYGVTTIDLKLEGLHELLERASRPLAGYAFAVDRNGKLLAFPDEKQAKVYSVDQQGRRTEEFIDVVRLAQQQPQFSAYAQAILRMNEQRLASASQLPEYVPDLATQITAGSYQIKTEEARLIAAVLATLQGKGTTWRAGYQELFIDNDPLLGQAAFAAVFEMPRTYWKIVTVMPYSAAMAASNTIYTKLLIVIAVVMSAALLAMLLVVRRILVRPISDMSGQLRQLTQSGGESGRLIDLPATHGELGQLALLFNRRTCQLLDVQQELRQAQEGLEARVEERTEALRQEMQRRQEVRQLRDLQIERAERQHAAVVKLSLHEALWQGDIVTAAQTINEVAAEVLGVAQASIWLVDESRTCIDVVDLFDRKAAVHRQGLQLKMEDNPIYFSALAHDRSIAVEDMFSDPRTVELLEYAQTLGIGALLDSPVRIVGALCAVVCFEHVGGPRVWHEDEIRFAGEIADQVKHALDTAGRLESDRQIRRLAFYDPLTELANRRLFQETAQHEIDVAQRHAVYGGLIYLDLDNFKTLNDSLGHHVGDELLVQVAQRLKAALRKEDVAARLGGDEFVVLIPGMHAQRDEALTQALTVAGKIQSALTTTPYHLHGHEYVITSSMGVTVYPDGEGNLSDVLKHADTAMYRAKDEGKNRICPYSPEMQEAANRRQQIEQELRAAITAHEFELYYQPQLNGQGEVVGAEALVRWIHKDRGMVTPDEFIPVAEETGLILELGAWIVREACRFCCDLSLQQIAINISAIQFHQPDFVEAVARILDETGVSPDRVMLELTEGIVIADIDDTITKMNALREVGVRMSIDDFGTGYSSLAYLKQLPLDQLKINDKFVRDVSISLNDAVIAETIISMARHLGLKVVAEGVETVEQFQFLDSKGCDLYQGYYFSRPLPAAALEAFLGDEGRTLPRSVAATE